MKISGRREYLTSLESVAMTDIVLNMFIFFFISFSLLYTFSPQRIKQLDIKLPQAESGQAVKNLHQVSITVASEGPVYLDGNIVSRKELKEKMAKLMRENPDSVAIIHADRMTRFKEVVSVLDILTAVGVRNLNIAAVSE